MAEAIYIETTIPSLYVGRPSPRLIEAARQQLTKIWWDEHRQEFELVCSQMVLDECSRGETEMARKRLNLLHDVPLLDLNYDVDRVSSALLSQRVIPARAADDAVHIAVASVHEIDYLLTWNCRHLANPRIWRRISDCLSGIGFRATVICTPEDLIGDET